ncbi:MAG: aspartate/glutamate racemase family protein [Paracraurococcus sp.]
MPRIALIHAGAVSIPPVEAAFAALWPEATCMNLLDDSLFADRGAGALPPGMTDRFLALARYAAGTGADGILFTCSAFGPCIAAAAAALAPLPVLKPNEAMVEAACAAGRRIGLLATFPGTLATMPAEFPAGVTLVPHLVEGAFAALQAGDMAEHDRLVVDAARHLADCDAIALAQFSLSRAAPAVEQALGRAVLTTPGSAVRKLRGLLSPA